MQIKSIDQLLETLNSLQKQILNLANDSDVFFKFSRSLDGWEDKLKEDVEICISNTRKFINELVEKYKVLYKEAQILITEYKELYLKNNLGGLN